jgi:anti-sigma B factor antagonist
MTNGAMFRSMRQGPQGSTHPSDAKTESFRVEVNPGKATVVAPVGELDMLTVDELEGTLRQAFDCGCRHLVLDLRGLSFLDSQGLHLVKRWNSLAERSGVTFEVIQGGPAVRRLFEIVGLLDQLPFLDSIGDGPAASERAPS